MNEQPTAESATGAASANEIEARLGEISAQMAARAGEQDAAPEQALPEGFACPIDPAGREACDACQ
jgi:hypothetical protein